jgi:hypothetical protein
MKIFLNIQRNYLCYLFMLFMKLFMLFMKLFMLFLNLQINNQFYLVLPQLSVRIWLHIKICYFLVLMQVVSVF